MVNSIKKTNNHQLILGIETSCDETAASIAALRESGVALLSNIVSSSSDLQSKYGGIIPEQAAREQIKVIIPVIQEALSQAGISQDDINSLAVTSGPGLIGSLLVGVETAKILSLTWDKPLTPINHLISHFYANWITRVIARENEHENLVWESQTGIPSFPFIGLLISGGHSDILLFENHGQYKYLGGTRDDAAGECFDKCARILGLPYPGGPQISKLAKEGNPKSFNLPRPLQSSDDYDFSFSGLKTAVSNLTNTLSIIAC